MLLSEENCKPLGLREDGADQPWNGSETSEGWMDGTVHGPDNDQQGQSNQKPANVLPPVPVDSIADASTRIPCLGVERATADTGYSDKLSKQEVKRYKSKYHIFLCSVEPLRKRMEAIEGEKSQIKPKQLSTMSTAKEINNLTTTDLINSIKAICCSSKPFTRENRKKFLGFHNWVLVDLSRRMQVIHQRFERRYKGRAEEEVRKQIINNIAGDESVKSIITATTAFKMTTDGEFFDLFPPFVERKRNQILSVASVIGDEICALTEFIDIKEIGEMDPDEHMDFLHDLQISKTRMKLVVEAVKDSSPFHGDPTSSYDKVEILDDHAL